MMTRNQLVLELAAQFYINKDRVTVGWGVSDPSIDKSTIKDFPDPDRQWYVYRDEWYALSKADRQVWFDKAKDWLSSWEEKYAHLYNYVIENGKPVFSVE